VEHIVQNEGLRDELEEKKQQGGIRVAVVAAVVSGIVRAAGNSVNTALHRATQRTQHFIRWVRWVVHPLVEKRSGLQTFLAPCPGPSRQNPCTLMTPILDTVALLRSPQDGLQPQTRKMLVFSLQINSTM